LLNITHIGSTAVEGLAAKPIIDILIEVSSLQALDANNDAMASLCYVAKGENGIADRRYFQKGGINRTHHVHAFLTADPNITRHIAFKEYLMTHKVIAQQYGTLKRSSAKLCNNDINDYSRATWKCVICASREACQMLGIICVV